jgi:hypothetical protein
MNENKIIPKVDNNLAYEIVSLKKIIRDIMNMHINIKIICGYGHTIQGCNDEKHAITPSQILRFLNILILYRLVCEDFSNGIL